MNQRKRSQPPEPARQPDSNEKSAPTGSDEITPAEAEGPGDAAVHDRRKAAATLLSPAITPAAAGAMLDADPRLDDRSETEEALERAKGTPD